MFRKLTFQILGNLTLLAVFSTGQVAVAAGNNVSKMERYSSSTFTNCTTQTQIPAAECNVLLALYNSTNGAGWINKTGWLQTDIPCSWSGVTCTAGHVTELYLTGNNLIGMIPAAMGNLTNLTKLVLSGNQLSGSIPTQLGNLINLTHLELSSNHLSGAIPSQLGNLTNLTRLNFFSNQLTGSIPSELGNLTNLISLSLESNQLTSFIPPQLGNLTNLIGLFLGVNQLTGSIPPQLGNLTNLRGLHLINNQLTGSIPSELGNLTNLTDLNLSVNRLTGSIPAQLGSLTNLASLNLGTNYLTGSIPAQLGSLTNLKYLRLYNNQLTGSFPAQLGNLTKLNYFWLDNNKLGGEIPASITALSSLTSLTLSCGLSSTNASVIAFIEALVPGWQNSICPTVLSIKRGNPNPTSSSSVNFTVTVSKPVIGVDITDFSLASSDITGASITNVGGSGTTYLVTVNTGTPNTSSIGLININAATLTELDSLQGIGPTTAQKIIDYRTLNGPFFVIEDIMNVSGIGPATFENIKNFITVGGSFLRLDVPVSATIADLAGNSLGNLPFKSGQVYTINKPPALKAPVLRSPRTNIITNDALLTFWWMNIANGETYEVQFATNNAFTSIVDSEMVAGLSYTAISAFGDGKYYWHVRGHNASNQPGAWSSTRIFTIDTTGPSAPVLSSPADTASSNRTPTFKWDSVPEAVLYEFQYDDDSGFVNSMYTVTVRGTSRKPPAMGSGMCYWQVRAKDAAGNWGDWSVPFTINITGP